MIQISKIEELNWKPVENTTPIKCNWCNKTVGEGGHYTEVRITSDSEFTFMVCSDRCLESFRSHPHILNYINENLAKVQ